MLALFCQGCNTSTSSGSEDTEPSESISTEIIETETIETEEVVEDSTEEAETLLASQAPPMAEIHVWTTTIGNEEYVDALVSVESTEDSSFNVEKMNSRIKIRGNSSQWIDKKSYNVKFDEKISLLGMDSGKKWSLLATGYERSLLRTPIGFLYAQAIGIQYASQFHMVELWINDVYNGVYVLIEPVQEGKNRVDIDLDTGDFLLESNFSRKEEGLSYIRTNQGFRFEINEPEEPTEEQKNAYLKWLNEAEAAIVSMDHTKYENYIDVESFVNYYIYEEVTKNVDFGNLSTRYYCKDGKLYAGPPWDMDLSMGNVSDRYTERHFREYHNILGQGLNNGDSTQGMWAKNRNWFKWLCEDEYFMDLVRDRWRELLPITYNLYAENDLGVSRMDYLLNAYKENILRNYTPVEEGGAGWRYDEIVLHFEHYYIYKDYDECIAYLRNWLEQRVAWLNTQFNPIQPR